MGTLPGSIKPVQHSVITSAGLRAVHGASLDLHIQVSSAVPNWDRAGLGARYTDCSNRDIATVQYLHSQACPGTSPSPDQLIKLGWPLAPSSTFFWVGIELEPPNRMQCLLSHPFPPPQSFLLADLALLVAFYPPSSSFLSQPIFILTFPFILSLVCSLAFLELHS